MRVVKRVITIIAWRCFCGCSHSIFYRPEKEDRSNFINVKVTAIPGWW